MPGWRPPHAATYEYNVDGWGPVVIYRSERFFGSTSSDLGHPIALATVDEEGYLVDITPAPGETLPDWELSAINQMLSKKFQSKRISSLLEKYRKD